MKKAIPFLLAAILTACGWNEAPENENVPTVEELASGPVRLKELRQQCKTDRATLGDVLCNRVQPGEELVTVAAGNTVRWIVSDTFSGAGDELRVNVQVKPVRSGLKTNLIITTNRRTYLLELTSTERAWMASVSWDCPRVDAGIAVPGAGGQRRRAG
ncbi:TrbG/VirB9 family P-type conjugative transfer protein [Paracoccus kondratievae]